MPTFAMKVYDLQWFTTFGMDVDQAADALAEDGIDVVLTQNHIDPLPTSGVDQHEYLTRYRDRIRGYDDRAWVDALKRHGLTVLETSAVLFDPPALSRFPDARPVDANGEPHAGFDWYVGVCPTHEGYLDERVARLARVVEELSPDGLFLQFIRYPGFWENWTWSPDYQFSDSDRYCFCDRCRSRFSDALHISLPQGDPASQARFILTHHGTEWTNWRCGVIADIVRRVREIGTANSDGTQLMLNTLPFPSTDFGNQDVRREIAAQDLRLLFPYTDRFELMTYLQILNRPVSWLRTAIEDARAELDNSGSAVVCTLQGDALYTEGIHGSRMRPPTVTADEIFAEATAAIDAGASGLVFYHWTDFLVDEAAGGRKREALRSITHA
jgi:hypothetical protein